MEKTWPPLIGKKPKFKEGRFLIIMVYFANLKTKYTILIYQQWKPVSTMRTGKLREKFNFRRPILFPGPLLLPTA